jgi:hypothetical protein
VDASRACAFLPALILDVYPPFDVSVLLVSTDVYFDLAAVGRSRSCLSKTDDDVLCCFS